MGLPFPGPADAEGLDLYAALTEDHEAIAAEFAAAALPAPTCEEETGAASISVTDAASQPWDAAAEVAQRQWLARVANQFVNSLRPRVVRLIG